MRNEIAGIILLFILSLYSAASISWYYPSSNLPAVVFGIFPVKNKKILFGRQSHLASNSDTDSDCNCRSSGSGRWDNCPELKFENICTDRKYRSQSAAAQEQGGHSSITTWSI